MYWFILLCISASIAQAEISPSVNTAQGVVIGSVTDENYFAFHGIPYAGPTSGKNRFKAPTPAPKISGALYAAEDNIMCAQINYMGHLGKEDCLTLSIFTKNLTTPKPVVVWLQGEDFQSSLRDDSFFTNLVESDLVIVSMNYRLSIFGFLCLGVPDAPGNAGLKDVVQGLKWIQDNISGFGGDPNNVVLLGFRSGAAMVDLITLSPVATGLVHKAIALSGSGLAPWAVAYDPVGHANTVANKLGYGGKDREELAKLLMTTDVDLLLEALYDFEFRNNTVLFGPCIENVDISPDDAILTDAPINLLRSNNYPDIPYIGSYTNLEGSIKSYKAEYRYWLEGMQANFSDFIQVDLKVQLANDSKGVINSIREFYFAQKEMNMEVLENFVSYEGDTTIVVPMTRNVRHRALTSKSEVRLFEHAYHGVGDYDYPYTQVGLIFPKLTGILNYLFDFNPQRPDGVIRDIILKRFLSFVHTGNPNPRNENFTNWLPFGKEPFVLLLNGEEVNNTPIFKEEMRVDLHEDMLTFWEDLYEKYYVPPKAITEPLPDKNALSKSKTKLKLLNNITKKH